MLGNKLGFLVVSSSVVIDPDLEGRMEAPVVGLARLSCRPSFPQAGPQLHGIPPVSGLTGLTQADQNGAGMPHLPCPGLCFYIERDQAALAPCEPSGKLARIALPKTTLHL